MQEYQFPWQRRVFVLDEPPAQGRYGWPPRYAKAGVLLAQERATAVIVLRGERGMGKTYALRQERDALLAAGLHPAWLELKRCTTTRRAQSHMQTALTPPTEPGEWHVLLDGLDEGLNDLPQLDQLLQEALEDLPEADRERLRLRITCRSARWPARFEESLRADWQPDQIKIMGLAPLGPDDVAVAAEMVGVADTAALLESIQQQGLVALATHPVTLLQLLDSYAVHARLPATVHDAYLQACLRLCTEHRRPTNPAQLQTQTSPEHLLAVAARLAATMQFGPYTAVTEDESRTTADLRLSRLDGFDEPGHLGGSVPCTLWNLRQVTESSLLVPTGDLRWAFAHDSYREFLAAHFLRMHHLQPQPQRQLLWIGDGQARHIIPAQQEVAAWRATSDTTLFADLMRDDPLVLLLADLPSLPDTDRERAVDALFALLERDDTVSLDHSLLHRLNHRRLADQLRPRLQKPGQSRLTYAVVSIARACPHPELADDLLDVAEDDRHDTGVRTAALAGVTEPTPDALTRIMDLAQDPSPEVIAAALRHLYPGHLTVTGYLDCIRDPDPAFVGTAFFLRREAPAQLDDSTIAEAAGWAGRALHAGDAQSTSPGLALAVLARAVTLNEDTPALDLVPVIGEGLLGLADDEERLHSSVLQTALEELAQALDSCPRTRRLLARHLLQHAEDNAFYSVLAGIPGGSFLPGADLLYWMEHWEQLTAINPARARQAVRFAPPEDPETRARADAARRTHPTLAEATAFWETYRRDQQERAARAEARRQQQRFDPVDLNTALDEVLAAVGPSVLTAWNALLRCLRRAPDGSPTRHTGGISTLADRAPSRPTNGTEPARRLSQAATHLLSEVPPLTTANFRPDSTARRPSAELTAFALVDHTAALHASPAHWAGWAVALAQSAAYDDDERDLQRTWMPLCVARAEDQLLPLLLDTLDHSAVQTLRDLVKALERDSTSGLRTVLSAWARHSDRSPEQWYAVLEELAAAEDAEALSHLVDALATDPRGHEPGSPPRQRWLFAARALLRHDILPDHWPALRRGLGDVTVLKEYGDLLTGVSTGPDGWPFDHLDDDALVDLYVLLLEDIGIARLQRPWRSGFIQDEDRLVDLLRHLPRILASRETHHAAAALHRLAQAYPQVWQLRMLARATARAAAARNAQPLEPEQLIRLATEYQTRLVRDARQLLDLVRESLTRMEEDLQGYNGTAVTLWNRNQSRFNSSTQCWPCWEDDLSDTAASFLRRDIGGHRIVVNREVQVRRDGLPGLRTDVQIEAPAPPGTGEHTLRVVIEAKGCWNPELPTTARTQLRAYLSEPDTAGLLLVGYFDCARWNTKRRSCPATNHAIDDVRREQHEQVRQLTQDGTLLASAHVLDCRLPDENSDWRKTADEPEV
ncbi:NACHT domain-containing protein [Streptomyces sp. NPDC052023]|uniref:NACHT domain-containing protein n=1 Tax=Streptomyces sp. NPDC052023 TaxID=3365681 RepID=UPI0037D6C661